MSSNQEEKTSTELIATLPMAREDQLHWVELRLSYMSSLFESTDRNPSAASSSDGGEEPPTIWWPCLIFNDYDQFIDFFEDEFNASMEERSLTKGIMQQRMLKNMLQQKTYMIARLLGLPLSEYVEIVELEDLTEAYQAVDFVTFTRLPQDVHIPQMKWENFTVKSISKETNEETTIVDDELFMKYMLALDYSSTKRMRPTAAYDDLKSDFRTYGEEKLQQIPPSVQRNSKISNFAASYMYVPAKKTNGEIIRWKKGTKVNSEESNDSDSDSNEDTEKGSKSGASIAKATNAEADVKNGKESAEDSNKATLVSTPVKRGRGRPKKKVDQQEITAEEEKNTLASTPVKRGRGRPKKKADQQEIAAKEEKNTLVSTPVKRGRGRPKKKANQQEIAAKEEKKIPDDGPVYSPMRASPRGRRPKTIVDLGAEEMGRPLSPKRSPKKAPMRLENKSTPSQVTPPSPKKKKGPGRPKKKDVSSESAKKEEKSSSQITSPSPKKRGPGRPKKQITPPSSKKRSPGRPKKKASTPQISDKEKGTASGATFSPISRRSKRKATSSETVSMNPPPRKKIARGRTKKKAGIHMTPKNDDDKSEATMETADETSPVGTPATFLYTPPPTIGRHQKLEISNDDTFEEVCHKLEFDGWTVDVGRNEYYSPGIGFDDIKGNPHWRGIKFFLSKQTFLGHLKNAFGWKPKRGRKSSSTVPRGRKSTNTITRSRRSSNTVTPTPSSRPKRNRRSPFVEDASKSATKKTRFKSSEEEEFYHFRNLIQMLTSKCDWKYQAAKTRDWHYVLPGRPTERKGGKHLEDFFFEESEVVLYCMNNKYFEKRKKLGLDTW